MYVLITAKNDQLQDIKDYKFFCFNGKVKCFKIDFDRFTNHHANYYDVEGNLLPFGEADYPPNKRKLKMPYNLKDMIRYAEKLAGNEPFLRVDFYEVNGKVYFGEMTFYLASGFGKIPPDEWDNVLGDWIVLPIK